MSEDATKTSQKRVLFNEDMNVSTGVVYPKSPIPRSTRIPKNTTHFSPIPSGQGTSKFRHKSPASRHLSPHRSLSKNKVMLDWEDVNNSVRKTQSTALPPVINTPWSRSTTVSTPDFKVEDRSVGTDDNPRNENSSRRSKFSSLSHFIFIVLNCIILTTGLLHCGGALILTIYKETASTMMDNWHYVAYIVTLYINAIIQIILPITGLTIVPHKSWKRYAACSLHVAVLTLAMGKFQLKMQSSIQNNLPQRMMDSVTQPDDAETAKIAWDYIQKTFKCCGVRGSLDWCRKINFPEDTNAENFVGEYICHLPVSCCIENIDELLSSKASSWNPEKSITPCSISPSLLNTNRDGCLGQVKREMHYVGALLKFLNFGPGIVMLLAAGAAAKLGALRI